jgi:hypothetical protein
MAKKSRQNKATKTARATGKRGRLSVDGAMIAVLIGAMDANAHVSREEAWRAHHIIWSMRRFRNRPGEDVDRQIDAVRARMVKYGKDIVLLEAVRTLPARLRPSAFALAVDLLLADARLEPVEKRFVKQLAVKLNIQPGLANDLVRAMVIKNTA